MRGIACVTLSSEELLLFPTLRPMFHKPFLVHNGTDMPQLITSYYIYIYTPTFSSPIVPSNCGYTNDFTRLKLIALSLIIHGNFEFRFLLLETFPTANNLKLAIQRLRQLEATGTISREQQLLAWKDPRNGKPPSPATAIDQEQTSRLGSQESLQFPRKIRSGRWWWSGNVGRGNSQDSVWRK